MTYIDAMRIISKVKRIRHYGESYSSLCKLISDLLIGTTASQGLLEENHELFRVLPFRNEIKGIGDLSYPPPNICKINRCNLDNKPVFYASFGAETAIFEKRISNQCEIVLSRWRILKRLWHYNLFWYNQDSSLDISDADILINNFIKESFETDNSSRADIYYLTNAITQNILGNTISIPQNASDSIKHKFESISNVFASVKYPSVANYKKDDNIAILPEYVNDYIKLTEVYKIELSSTENDSVTIQIKDIGKIDSTGIIVWAGNTQCWEMPKEVMSASIRVNEHGFIEPTENSILLPKILKFDIKQRKK